VSLDTEGTIMNKTKAALTAMVILLGLAASAPALAWRGGGHVRFGVFIGAPFYAPWYGYPAPYYYPPAYYPPTYYQPASPPTYIEQGEPQAAPAQAPAQAQSQGSQGYWYYCADAKAYYPYVKECPGGWQRVAPQPPAR
jgi:hypothetical protein